MHCTSHRSICFRGNLINCPSWIPFGFVPLILMSSSLLFSTGSSFFFLSLSLTTTSRCLRWRSDFLLWTSACTMIVITTGTIAREGLLRYVLTTNDANSLEWGRSFPSFTPHFSSKIVKKEIDRLLHWTSARKSFDTGVPAHSRPPFFH